MNSQALLRRAFTGDTTLEDLFIVAVRTTGIYCRPSCNPPRKPKLENRVFFKTPLDACKAGFRPCKLCRPDTVAPLELEKNAVNALIHNAKRDPAMFESVEAMATAANMSVTRLYKLFKQHRGVTPAEILARVRIEAACKHLETSMARASTAFEHFEIMLASLTMRSRNDAQCPCINNHLAFERVMLFLSAVPAALLFLGRSIGVSATSTMTTSNSICSRRARLLGKLNNLEAINASSTRRTVRIAVVS
jgi:methylphosphotriester-DNA--protein-cysteine methyltransferase